MSIGFSVVLLISSGLMVTLFNGFELIFNLQAIWMIFPLSNSSSLLSLLVKPKYSIVIYKLLK